MKVVLKSICFLGALTFHALAAENIPSLDEAVKSKLDLWGDAAMSQTNGASYEFFEKLLPPLLYVNADFRYYPIVLSAPNAKHKARLISNGSGINLQANGVQWHDFGTPVLFRAGPTEIAFGEPLQKLNGPHLAEGYLPIVQISCENGGNIYSQESFASVDPVFSNNAVVLTRFGFAEGSDVERDKKGRIAVRLETREPLSVAKNVILNQQGEVLLWFDKSWKWDTNRLVLTAIFSGKETNASIAVATVPLPSTTKSPLAENGFEVQRKLTVQAWNRILADSMNIETPEPVVNNAWRALLLQNFSLINGDSMRYSAGNQYDALYETEGSDALMAMLLWGRETDARRLMVPLLDFIRDGIKYQQAGTKLQNISRYFWQTRDAEFVKSIRPKWEKEIKRIVDNRTENGLVPRERYCNDIATPIFSLNTESKCWRGLRDISAVLQEMKEPSDAQRLGEASATLRKNIFAAVEKSIFTNTQPPFIPIALFGEEKPYDPICATRMGSYWNLLVNFVIGNEALGPGSQYENWLLEYLQQHGGLCMGMERARPWPGWWISTENVNPLYGTRYMLTLLRRDEPERALVSFYGMLAQGFTRETFYAGEGSSIVPLDHFGRQVLLTPNSAGNAHLLTMLRNLLVQDLDLNDDGKPETLRMGFASPKRWLEDGKKIKVERAPTAFGPVSFSLESKLNTGEVLAQVDLPTRNHPEKILLRVRPPDGFKVVSARVEDQKVKLDESGTVDLSLLHGKQTVHFAVSKK